MPAPSHPLNSCSPKSSVKTSRVIFLRLYISISTLTKPPASRALRKMIAEPAFELLHAVLVIERPDPRVERAGLDRDIQAGEQPAPGRAPGKARRAMSQPAGRSGKDRIEVTERLLFRQGGFAEDVDAEGPAGIPDLLQGLQGGTGRFAGDEDAREKADVSAQQRR